MSNRLLVSKDVFEVLKEFLQRDDIWSRKGSAQILNDLYYLEPPEIEIPDERLDILE